MGLTMHSVAREQLMASGRPKTRYNPPPLTGSMNLAELVRSTGRHALLPQQFTLITGRRDDPDAPVYYAGALSLLKPARRLDRWHSGSVRGRPRAGPPPCSRPRTRRRRSREGPRARCGYSGPSRSDRGARLHGLKELRLAKEAADEKAETKLVTRKKKAPGLTMIRRRPTLTNR
jgi:hypothetical protein